MLGLEFGDLILLAVGAALGFVAGVACGRRWEGEEEREAASAQTRKREALELLRRQGLTEKRIQELQYLSDQEFGEWFEHWQWLTAAKKLARERGLREEDVEQLSPEELRKVVGEWSKDK